MSDSRTESTKPTRVRPISRRIEWFAATGDRVRHAWLTTAPIKRRKDEPRQRFRDAERLCGATTVASADWQRESRPQPEAICLRCSRIVRAAREDIDRG